MKDKENKFTCQGKYTFIFGKKIISNNTR